MILKAFYLNHCGSCSKRILVTEFIDGVKISDTKSLLDRGYDVSTIGQRLIKIFAEQVNIA